MTNFSSTLPIIIYDRLVGSQDTWQDFDQGPGFFHPREGYELNIRIHNINDQTLLVLVNELEALPELVFLNLAENRKITDAGMEHLGRLKQLKGINLSSCDISGEGLVHLSGLSHLEHLNLSYCNRIADQGLKMIKSLHNLTYLDLQRCVKITRGGMSKIDRRGLVIHYK